MQQQQQLQMEAAAQQELAAQAQPVGLRERIGFVGAGQARRTIHGTLVDMRVLSVCSLNKARRSVCTAHSSLSLDQYHTGVCVAQMGEALIRGFIQSGVSSAANLSASVRSEERQRAMQQLGIQARCQLVRCLLRIHPDWPPHRCPLSCALLTSTHM